MAETVFRRTTGGLESPPQAESLPYNEYWYVHIHPGFGFVGSLV
jgi:hypothetical protein